MKLKEFFIPGEPARVTAQQRRIGPRLKSGRYAVYMSPKIAEARAELLQYLRAEAPEEPWAIPVALRVMWWFGTDDMDKAYTSKTTRPDLDNLEKMLLDCMTESGFWKDDSLVVMKTTGKLWAPREEAGIEISLSSYGG